MFVAPLIPKINMMVRLIPALLLASAIACSQAATITGLVVGVADGDTVTVLDASKTQHKIRLSGIDAPEKKQAFGMRSKQSLSDLVLISRSLSRLIKRTSTGAKSGKSCSLPGRM